MKADGKRRAEGRGEAAAALRHWYASPAGRVVLAHLVRQVERRVSGVFGYHALQAGALCPDCDLLAGSRIPHRFCLDPEAGFGEVQASAEALPVAADSVDLVLLPHTLDFADEPHQVLREVDRVLIPEGHVLVIGFNPLSFFGLWKLALGWRGRAPWSGRFVASFRVRDWASLLGFDVLACDHLACFAPWQRDMWLRRVSGWERFCARVAPRLGGVYVLLARKRVTTLTPIKPRWRPRRAVLAGHLPGPSHGRSMR